MTVWFTADLHLGHVNIIGYCNRPFAGVAAMNDEIVRRWNDTVAAGDTVWVLGDVALGQIDHSLALVDRMAGRKLLVAGNHDRCWAGNGRKARAWTERYVDAGFEVVHQGEVVVDIEGAGMTATACHFPYRGDSHDEDRYLDHRPVDRGGWLLHGHVHDQWRQRDRMINVGVDAWDYRPVSTDVLGALMAAGPTPGPTIGIGGERRGGSR